MLESVSILGHLYTEAGLREEEVLKGLGPIGLDPAQTSGSMWPFGATWA